MEARREVEEGLARLQEDDRLRLAQALEDGMSRMLEWATHPEPWWEDCKVSKVRGVGDVVLKSKAQPAARLFLGVAEFEDVTMAEMRFLTKAGEGCAKLRFDPTLKQMETLLAFGAPWGEEVHFLRTTTHPALMGIISSREVDDICTQKPLPDGRWVECGTGLQGPLVAQHVDGSARLEQLVALPPSEGMVRAIDVTSGFIHEPLDDAARSGGRGRCRLWYFLSSDAGGGVPRWAAEKGVGGAITGFFAALPPELTRLRAARAAQ